MAYYLEFCDVHSLSLIAPEQQAYMLQCDMCFFKLFEIQHTVFISKKIFSL